MVKTFKKSGIYLHYSVQGYPQKLRRYFSQKTKFNVYAFISTVILALFDYSHVTMN